MEQIGKTADTVIDGLWERDKSRLGILDLAALGLESDRWLSSCAREEIRERFDKIEDHQLRKYLNKQTGRRWPVLQQVAAEILTRRSHSYLVEVAFIVKNMAGEMLGGVSHRQWLVEAKSHVEAAEKTLKRIANTARWQHKQPVQIETLKLIPEKAPNHPDKPQKPKGRGKKPKPQQLKLL